MAGGIFSPIDALFGVDGEDAGKQYNQQALDAFYGITPPSAHDLTYNLQQENYTGDLTPDQSYAIDAAPSEYNNITSDPAARAAQMQALAQTQDIATNGGLTTADKAGLEDVMNRTNQQERGNREAILQNARQRGVGGSGLELAAQLANEQNSANSANQAGLDVAKTAQQRALQAIQESGQMGSQIEGQKFSEAASKAAAQDAINKYNAMNTQQVVSANTAAKNAAQARNLDARQTIGNQNTAISNEQAKATAQAKQQAFNNQMNRATGMGSAYNNLAEGKRNAAQNQQAFNGQLLGTGAQIASGYMAAKNKPTNNYYLSDETKKKDIQDADVDSFLESLHPKSFKYKDPNEDGASDGENVGVMAQDVEKTPVGKTMVKNTSNGKMIDMQKGFGVILAALAALHDKMESDNGEAA